jgi:DNA-binding winged helix-turn-helix (wHTH) protein
MPIEAIQGSRQCPCCGGNVAAAEVLLDTQRGRVAHNGKTVHIGPSQMNIMRCLAQNWPNAASYEALHQAIWRHNARCIDPEGLMRVQVSKLRRNLRPLGIKIANARQCGYRLTLTDDMHLSPRASSRRPFAEHVQ